MTPLGWKTLDAITDPKVRNVAETNRDGYEGRVPNSPAGIEAAQEQLRRTLAVELERARRQGWGV
jgi:hypothetical protein